MNTSVTRSNGYGRNGRNGNGPINGSGSVRTRRNPAPAIADLMQAYLQACEKSNKVGGGGGPKAPAMPQLESVSRISSIPLVESGVSIGGKLYTSIKESNPLFRWSFSTAESSFQASVNLAIPAVVMLEGPIKTVDRLLCKSLDAVEQRVPSVYLPPQIMYSNTCEYVSSHVVRPVVRRANSVSAIGEAVLDSSVTAYAASRLRHALDTADRYVDHYLPPDSEDVDGAHDKKDGNVDAVDGNDNNGSGRASAVQAVQTGVRLRRKLQRRLTRQAFAEAKAIKEQINILVYAAELLATDPRMAWSKARELYIALSLPEPENQARPSTLEELAVLVAREAARRLVHLINYTANDLPSNVRSGVGMASQLVATAADSVAKVLPSPSALVSSSLSQPAMPLVLARLRVRTTCAAESHASRRLVQNAFHLNLTIHFGGAKESAYREMQMLKLRMQELIIELRIHSRTFMEQLALILAGNDENNKPRSRHASTNTNANATMVPTTNSALPINGIN